MGQITITLSDDLENSIRSYVSNKGYTSISDFIREAASNALYESPSFWERSILIKLMELQKASGLNINEEALGALVGGYSIFYPKADIGPSDEMSEEDMRFVMDILDMYRWLQFSYRELDDKDKDDQLAERVKFRGFDGNASDGYLAFTRFLQENNRWLDLELATDNDGLNSHMPVNDMYARMLSEYKKYKWRGLEVDLSGPKPLTLEQLKEIIDARIHPDNRKNGTTKSSKDR